MVMQKHVFFFICIFSLLLIACQSTPVKTVSEQPFDALDSTSETTRQLHNLYATLHSDNTSGVAAELYSISQQQLTSQELNLLTLTQAKTLFLSNEPESALVQINSINTDAALASASSNFFIEFNLLKADILLTLNQPLASAQKRSLASSLMVDSQQQLENQQTLWLTLSLMNRDEIKLALTNEQNTIFRQWLELSLIAHYSQYSLDQQIEEINNWQKKNATHPGALAPPFEISATRIATRKRPNTIAVLLPFDDKYKNIGNAIRDGIMTAFYASNYRPKIMFYSVANDQDILPIYQDVIRDGAELVIGPLFNKQLENLYQKNELPVTTIALNKTDIKAKPAKLFEFSLSQDDEINSIIKLAKQRQHKSVIILAQKDNWATNASEYFQQQWHEFGGDVISTGSFNNNKEQSTVIQNVFDISLSKDRIRKLKWAVGNLESEPRRRKDIDMILILSKPKLAASLRPLLSFHYANDLDLFATSSIYRGYQNSRSDSDFNGIQFSDLPLIIEPSKTVSNNYKHSSLIRMYAFGIDAFQLSERIHLMQQLPSIKLYGATGALALNEQQIVRDMAFAKFSRGKVVPMTTARAVNYDK